MDAIIPFVKDGGGWPLIVVLLLAAIGWLAKRLAAKEEQLLAAHAGRTDDAKVYADKLLDMVRVLDRLQSANGGRP